MKKLIGVLVVLAGIVGAFYFGFRFLVGGIVDIGEGFKANPVDGWRVIWGIVQIFLLSEVFSVACLAISLGFGGLIFFWGEDSYRIIRFGNMIFEFGDDEDFEFEPDDDWPN